MAISTVSISMTFTAGTQVAADALRDAALLDYALARGLPIFQADGVTVDPTKVNPAIKAVLIADVKSVVVSFRTQAATAATFATQNALALT
jgi:hypothetical protein